MPNLEHYRRDALSGLHLPVTIVDDVRKRINNVTKSIERNVSSTFPGMERGIGKFNPAVVADSFIFAIADKSDSGLLEAINHHFSDWKKLLEFLKWNPEQGAEIFGPASAEIINLRLFPSFGHHAETRRVVGSVHVDRISSNSYFHHVLGPLSGNGFIPHMVLEDEEKAIHSAILVHTGAQPPPDQGHFRRSPYL